MRNILFRGRRIDTGEWVFGYFTKNRPSPKSSEPPYELQAAIDHEEKGVMLTSLVMPDTVGQFTGLVDKNGKGIYEGDVVQFKMFNAPRIGIVLVSTWFDNMCFEFKLYKTTDGSPKTAYPLTHGGEYYEVIGNVHDNPELGGEMLGN